MIGHEDREKICAERCESGRSKRRVIVYEDRERSALRGVNPDDGTMGEWDDRRQVSENYRMHLWHQARP